MIRGSCNRTRVDPWPLGFVLTLLISLALAGCGKSNGPRSDPEAGSHETPKDSMAEPAPASGAATAQGNNKLDAHEALSSADGATIQQLEALIDAVAGDRPGIPAPPSLSTRWQIRVHEELRSSAGIERAYRALASASKASGPRRINAPLADLVERRALACLVSCLSSPNYVIQSKALLALGRLNDPAAISPLLTYLEYIILDRRVTGGELHVALQQLLEDVGATLSRLTGLTIELVDEPPAADVDLAIERWRKHELDKKSPLPLATFGVIDGKEPPRYTTEPVNRELELVAESPRQWTGVAAARVSPFEERVFVCFPRWSDDVPISVGELKHGKVVPYPNESWNDQARPSLSRAERFVCVQALFVDRRGRLWILDPANPKFEGVVPGSAKLLQVDLETDRVVRTIRFDASVAPRGSYLNDVRIDEARGVAYLSDSGVGALVIVDLSTGAARRVLEGHVSTTSADVVLEIAGKPWLRPDGARPVVHVDGIALSPDRKDLYYQALTSRHLYRVPTSALREESLDPEELAKQVVYVGPAGASDGILFAANRLFLTSLEHDAIRFITTELEMKTLVLDQRLSWPDSLSSSRGWLYFTTARIHEGAGPSSPYGLWRIPLPTR